MECNGEKNSTRAALIFLSQIIGRKGTEVSERSERASESCNRKVPPNSVRNCYCYSSQISTTELTYSLLLLAHCSQPLFKMRLASLARRSSPE